MQFLIPLCMCLGLSVAQQLPSYYQGSYQVPNAPIPSPGAYGGASAYQQTVPPASATLASARQWSPATAARAQYASASPAYAGNVQAAPAAAPVSTVPSSYGWNVQHSAPQPAPQPQPQPAVIRAAPAAPQYQQYAAPQPQYAQAQAPQVARSWSPAQAAPQSWSPAPAAAQSWAPSQPAAPVAAPAAAYQAPANPISALARPASVHYASVGENLNGDYKFGYRTGNGDSFREETRAPDGTVQGQYGFTDADGKQRIVKYSAGVNGFQVLNDGQASPAAAAPASHAAPALPNWAQQGAPAAPAQWGAQPAAAQSQWG